MKKKDSGKTKSIRVSIVLRSDLLAKTDDAAKISPGEALALY